MMCKTLFAICGIALLAGCAAAPPAVTARSTLPGTWDWETATPRCGDTAGTFSFSADGRQVRVNVPSGAIAGSTPVGRDVVYEVLAEDGKLMRLRAVGETRTTDAGVPVEWDLLMLNADAFCWHRTDWSPGACTPLLKRCPAPSAP
jgi:hypothetical protein